MEKDNRFFRFLWRFNALVIAGLGLIVICIAGIPLPMEYFAGRIAAENPATFIPTKNTNNVTYALGAQSRLDGTPYILVDLNRMGQLHAGDGFSSGRGIDQSTVNLLLLDGDNGKSRWLLSGLNHIVWHMELRSIFPAPDDSHETVTGVIISSTPGNSGDNGVFKTRTPESLYYVPVGGSETTKFFSAEDIQFVDQIDATTILILYRNGQATSAVSYSVPSLKKLGEEPVPKVTP